MALKIDLEELHMLRTGMRTLMCIESGAGLRVNWSLKPLDLNKNLNRWTAFRETLQYHIPSKLVQLSSIWNLRMDRHGQPRVLVFYICKECVMTAPYWSAVPSCVFHQLMVCTAFPSCGNNYTQWYERRPQGHMYPLFAWLFSALLIVRSLWVCCVTHKSSDVVPAIVNAV
jgi:hypothetical protein